MFRDMLIKQEKKLDWYCNSKRNTHPSSIEKDGKGESVPDVMRMDRTFRNASSRIAKAGAKHQ